MMSKKYKIGYTQGVFDMFHLGHLYLLKNAKKLCDYLIVGVNSDLLAEEYKHKIPVIDENARAEIVRSIKVVDRCEIVHTLDKKKLLDKFKFNAIFIGDDWKGNPRWEKTKETLKEFGVDVIFCHIQMGYLQLFFVHRVTSVFEKNIMKNRVLYVDYIKAIGIILVVMGHINFANDFIKSWIYSFHMPLFFFSTGLVSNAAAYSCIKNELKYVLKKVKSLYLPYILWGLIYSEFSIKNFMLICYGSYQSIVLANSLSSLWFLPVMFLAVLEFRFFGYFANKNKVLLVILSCLSFTISYALPLQKFGYPFGINIAFTGLGFMLIGYFLGLFVERIRATISLKGFYFLLTLTMLIAFAGITVFSRINSQYASGYVLLATARYGNYGLFFINAIFGCIFVLAISLLVNKRNKILVYIGQNSLLVLAVHKPIIKLFDYIFSFIVFPKIMEFAVATIGTLFISCILGGLIDYFAPCLAGKEWSTKN